jgi:ABC-2 type transport system permease protein
MNPILLVAMRDYCQIAATRSFRITLLFLPLIFALSFMAQSFLRPPATSAYVLVDANGAYGAQIDRRVELDYQRQVLSDLAAYSHRWNVSTADQKAMWAARQGWYSNAQVAAFVAAGGADAALRRIKPLLPADASAFAPAARPFVKVAPPPDVPADRGAGRFGAAMAPYLHGNLTATSGKLPLALAIYIPSDFGWPGVPLRLWTTGLANAALIDSVRDELTQALKLRAFRARGLSVADTAQIEAMVVPLDVAQPPSGTGRGQMMVRSLVPLALTYLLLITAFITGGMMLQGIIEERSNRLLESVLACIRPNQLMFGKLLGLGAIGLTVMAVWVGCALGAAYFQQGFIADYLRPSLAMLQPWMVAAMMFYFIAGYLIVSMAFMAIGSVSNSMQDAQAYLMPVMMTLMLPVILMMGSIFSNPGGALPRVMSWIPIYTPFTMLMRLGNGVSLAELLGTGALLIVFVAVELFALGRVFQASLLNTGQPPKLSALFKLMFQQPFN